LKARIEVGDDFAQLARSHSEDPGSAAGGGDLGWVSPGTMDPDFERVMNSLQPNQVSQPFQTQFGWHIVQVIARREHDDSTEATRARARDAIRQRKTEEELQAWLRRLRDEAYVEYRMPGVAVTNTEQPAEQDPGAVEPGADRSEGESAAGTLPTDAEAQAASP
jgi:peptidyl-prolyl cis-trans isomerase SurA